MLNSIVDLTNADGEGASTAVRLARHLAEKGVGRGSIRDEHLRSLYAALGQSKNTSLGREVQAPEPTATDQVVDDAVWGVIIETREHPALESVVSQFSEQLEIGIQLFCGSTNEPFIRDTKLSGLIEQGKVVLTPLPVETLSLPAYNSLFLSPAFWHTQMGRKKILVFQTDAVLCERSDYKLGDFLDYDYIGSNWPRERPVGMVIDGGSGGLSLRDWEKSVQCLGRFSASLWPGGEDGYFAFHLDLMGGRVARGEECSRFSTQTEFLFKSFGGHQLAQLDPVSLDRFFQYCPEARHTVT